MKIHYNNGVRFHKILYKRIKTLQILDFSNLNSKDNLTNVLSKRAHNLLREAIADKDELKIRQEFEELNEFEKCKKLFEEFNDFIELKSKVKSKYFNEYCKWLKFFWIQLGLIDQAIMSCIFHQPKKCCRTSSQ